jgi:histidyl-tRNA synthetase
MAADAEICMMAADTMEALGIPRGSYVVKVNNRKVLDGVLEAVGLAGEANAGRRLAVLRAIDKLDRLGIDGVRLLLGPGRKDESGDFTKGAQLTDRQIKLVTAMITAPIEEGTSVPTSVTITAKFADESGLDDADDVFEGLPTPPSFTEGMQELVDIVTMAHRAGYEADRIRIDPSVVRGLEYYTGPVYEVELTFPITGDDGKPVRFGSVAGGGRYDGLVARFRGEPVPATGFSIGVSRLLAALTHLGKIDAKPEPGPVIVTVFDKDRLADYQRMAATLRQAGIRAELYLGAGKFGPQMKYADRRGSPCVVIQGTDEKQKGEVQIKDLALGAELAGLSKEREDYLQKQAAAQFAVPEARLVEAVREVLARHKRS